MRCLSYQQSAFSSRGYLKAQSSTRVRDASTAAKDMSVNGAQQPYEANEKCNEVFTRPCKYTEYFHIQHVLGIFCSNYCKVYCRVFGSKYLTKNQNFEPGLKDWSALSESMSQQPQSSAEQVPQRPSGCGYGYVAAIFQQELDSIYTVYNIHNYI